MKSLSLNGSDWVLTGYWQHQWRMADRLDFPLRPAVQPVPATVPGAVHADLLRAGVIADWRDGLEARHCEWVNHRDWSVKRTLAVPDDFDGRLTLECGGLDYSGCVRIDGEPVGTFEGTHLRHPFDLTGRVAPGESFELEFIFDVAPQIDGVFGFTSRTRQFKPRFGYHWDWCTWLVNVGIWQDVRLVSRGPAVFESCRVLPRVGDDLASGVVRVQGFVRGAPVTLRYVLRDAEQVVVADGQQDLASPSLELEIPVDHPRLWWPATHGAQPLYRLTLELLGAGGRVSDAIERTIGFKRICWQDNDGAPDGARPYVCEVNGSPVFLRGVNWVPLSPLYGTVTPQQYDAFMRLYRNMNANVLRVWGGGILETPAFYEACDRHGLLVWQEFPLSSSGIDNWPPEEPDVIEELERIATDYVERRAHHACHLLWCGGNELQGALDGGKVGVGRPVDESHPLMRQWAKLVERLDPGKRFQASSPSGPRFYADAGDFGKGLHHQTHGPWGNLPLSERYDYFNGDDSLFRSEVGAPGCSSLAALERHRGDEALWPPRETNPYWLVPAGSWIPWEDVTREFGEIPDEPSQLPLVVKASRYLQAESYRYVAEATRRRHPGCSGLIIWMGHDSVPCTSNNSVVQIDASTKPAYDWLQRAWSARHVSLRHRSMHYAPGARVTGEVWISRDEAGRPAGGRLTAALRTLDGRIAESHKCAVDGERAGLHVTDLDWRAPRCREKLFVIELTWEDGLTTVSNRYLLSQQGRHPLQPLRSLARARLRARREDNGRVSVVNEGDAAAIAVRLVGGPPAMALLARVNNLILFPGEAVSIPFDMIPSGLKHAVASGRKASLQVECFNAAEPIPVADTS